MKTYTMTDKATMRAVKSILKNSEKTAGRGWTKVAYLYSKGLMVTDGKRLLRVHDKDLEEEFGDFIRETGRTVTFMLEGDALARYEDMNVNDTEIGTMERLIPSLEGMSTVVTRDFVDRFCNGSTPKVKDISYSMLNMAIFSTGRWFNPELLDGMGIRTWEKVVALGAKVAFIGADPDEVLICAGFGEEEK